MVDTATEKCLRSLQHMNEEILKISENTIFSSPVLKDIPSSLKAEWLGGEDLLKVFREGFKKEGVDEKFNAARNDPAALTDQDQKSPPMTEKLIDRKNVISKEIAKIKEEQAFIESTIAISLERLENTRIPVIENNVVV